MHRTTSLCSLVHIYHGGRACSTKFLFVESEGGCHHPHAPTESIAWLRPKRLWRRLFKPWPCLRPKILQPSWRQKDLLNCKTIWAPRKPPHLAQIIHPPLNLIYDVIFYFIFFFSYKTGTKCKTYFDQHCFSLFCSSFSLPVLSPLRYKPLHLLALLKLFYKDAY